MAQKEHALARFYKTKFVGSRKTWSAKLPVDVKGEGGRGSDLNVQWALSGGTFEYVDGPLCNFFYMSDPLAHKTAQLTTTVLSLASMSLVLHTKENHRKRTRYAS